MKKTTFLLLVSGFSAFVLTCALGISHPQNFFLTGSYSKQFVTQDWFEKEDHDQDKDHPSDGDENRGGDDSLVEKKKRYEFRAYPAKAIPAGVRLKAWKQFQKLYPENQSITWKPVTSKANSSAR